MKEIRTIIANKIKYIDYYILIPFIILTCIGIVIVYSASCSVATQMGLSASYFLKRQFIYAILSFILAFTVFCLKSSFFRQKKVLKKVILIIGILLFILIIMAHIDPRAAVNGATEWIHIGSINIEPSEFAKIAIILYLSYVFSNKVKSNKYPDGMLNFLEQNKSSIEIVVFFGLLILIQPDTGGFAILMFIVLIMSFTSGIPFKSSFKWFMIFIIFAIVSLFFLVKFPLPFFKHSYQYQRIIAFAHPFKYAKTGGTQLINSYYAIINGGAFGRGLGQSIQKRGFLPEPYTDFIMSVITEELGVFGATLILGLLFFLIARIILVGIRARSSYNALICFGVGTWLFIQTIFNVGGMLGLLPITGVTLPFISYGGSSMMALSLAIGMVLNVDADEKNKDYLLN